LLLDPVQASRKISQILDMLSSILQSRIAEQCFCTLNNTNALVSLYETQAQTLRLSMASSLLFTSGTGGLRPLRMTSMPCKASLHLMVMVLPGDDS
jgi:hypothetical protein